MVTIFYNPNEFKLTASGHAGAGPKGKDIVCAGVSTLFYTLGEALMESMDMLEECPLIKDDDEEEEKMIICTPKKEYRRTIDRTYWTVLVGLKLLQSQYKGKVKVIYTRH